MTIKVSNQFAGKHDSLDGAPYSEAFVEDAIAEQSYYYLTEIYGCKRISAPGEWPIIVEFFDQSAGLTRRTYAKEEPKPVAQFREGIHQTSTGIAAYVGDAIFTVGDLKAMLQHYEVPDDTPIILSSDSEGNQYGRLFSASIEPSVDEDDAEEYLRFDIIDLDDGNVLLLTPAI